MKKIYFYLNSLFIFLIVGLGITQDYLTYFLEIFPILIVIPILMKTYLNIRWTSLVYFWIWIHCFILIFGGIYSYANNPLGELIQNIGHLSRNPYDRIGHWFQGFVPTLLVREVFIRWGQFKSLVVQNLLILLVVLGVSASYEILEYFSFIILGEHAHDFLGMLGDVWDAQWDMIFALIGSISCLISLSSMQDQQIKEFTVS